MNKKIWSAPIALVVVLVSALIFGGITVSADTVAEGTCGSGVTWTLDNEGVLTISGSGAIDSYGYSDPRPWYIYSDDIKSVVVEPGVTSIGSYAFAALSNLTSIDYSSDVTTIESYAFSRTALTSVTIPATVTNMGTYVFFDCQQLTSAVIEEGVTTIPGDTFSGCTSLTSVSIPSSVTTVESEAFYYTGLTSATISASWTSFGEAVYYHCVNLTDVTIEQGVTVIPRSTFSGCTALTSVDLPSSVTTIGVSAFSGSGLTEFTIPSTVTTIDSGAFTYSQIKTITIPTTVTSWGTAVFDGCKALKSVTIADGITSVPDYMFMDCTSLESVTIPSSVTALGQFAFSNTAIKSFEFTSNYKSIGISAFYGCSKLESVTFCDRDDTLFLGGNALAHTGLTSVTIPAYLTGEDWSIGTFKGVSDNAFDGCYYLATVEFLEGVERIGYRAFADCKSLQTITIPSTIKYIDGNAFRYTPNVTDIYCYAEPTFTWEEAGDDFMTSPMRGTRFHVLGSTSDFNNAYPGANVTFVGGTDFDARVVGHSVTLSADIGLNFFIRLPEGYNSDNTEVTFSWGLDNKATTAKGKLVSCNQHGANYKVTCYVFSYSMADEITMVVKSGNTELITDKYSVEKYINVLGLGHYYDQDDSLNDLLAAMVCYGDSAMKYFDYRKDYGLCFHSYVDQGSFNTLYDYRSDLNTVLPDPNNMTIKNIDLDELGIKFYAASVLCGSQNKIRFYFEVKDADKFSSLTASYNSQNLTFKSKTVNGQQLVYIETPGLAAGAIESAITVTIGGNDYTYDFRYYIQQCVANNAELKFADVACYLYAVSHYARIYQQGGSSNA